jgi:hypothetical protein
MRSYARTPTTSRSSRHPASRRRARGQADRGSSAAELAIATPLMMLLLLAVVQFALWEHATHVAHATATEALEAARDVGGTPAAGQAQAARVLAQTGGVLHDPRVQVTRDNQTVGVRIDATAVTVIPAVHLRITVTLHGVPETFRSSTRHPA